MENHSKLSEYYLEDAASDLIKTTSNLSKFHIERMASGRIPKSKNIDGSKKIVVNCLKADELPKLENVQRAYFAQVILRIYNELNIKEFRASLRNDIVSALSLRLIVKRALDSLMDETNVNLMSELIREASFKDKNIKDIPNLQKVIDSFNQCIEKDSKREYLLKASTDHPELSPIIQKFFKAREQFDKRLKKCMDETIRLIIDKSRVVEKTDNQLRITFKNFEDEIFIILGKDYSLDSLPD